MAIPPSAELKLPRELPAATVVTATDMLVGDNGVAVQKVTPPQIVDAAIPLASQAEAESGTDNTKRMTPLRVAQSIAFQGVSATTLASTGGAALVGALSGATVQGEIDILKQVDSALQNDVGIALADSTTALNTANAASSSISSTIIALSSPTGASLSGAQSPFVGSVARTLQDGVIESRSILEWMTDLERDAARSGDLSVDHTTSFNTAMASGADVIELHDYAYRIDGQVSLPTSGVRVIGNGWSAQRGSGVVNNGGKMFSAVAATGLIEIENGTLTGNVSRTGPGYDSFAAGMYFEETTGGVVLRNMVATGFAEGAYVRRVDGFTVIGGVYTGNILTGISGFANNVLIDGGRFFANGHLSAQPGLTHDLYFGNSSKGVIRNCYIGDPVDPVSYSLFVRYDAPSAVADFDDLTDWEIYNNRFNGGGVRFNSLGPTTADRRPVDNIRVYSNVFSGGADLRFDEPQACRSWGNRGINSLVVAVASSWDGYVVGYVSDDDECGRVFTNSLIHQYLNSTTAVVFKGTSLNNGADPAFNEIDPFGGYTACTIIEPRVRGTGAPFSAAALARYQTNLNIPVTASGSMRHLSRTSLSETAIANGGTWTPDNHTANPQEYLIGRFNGATGTVGAPVVSATGMTLMLLLRSGAANSIITFASTYKLSPVTAAELASGGLSGERMAVSFIYETGAWRQIGDASWVAA